ncbi:MAG TPA: ATP-binding protein [Bryobacteraceae bacterium]|nr:ATP-binding protein [Bryobacteraceae bacterium]
MLELVSRVERVASRVVLSPSQSEAANGIMRGLERGECAILQDHSSDGKTTVLKDVHRQLGGAFIGTREFLTELAANEPVALEETFLDLLDEHIAEHELVIVDDLHLLIDVVEGCDYPRKGLLDVVLTAVIESAAAKGTKMLFATQYVPAVIARRGHTWLIEDFEPEDFVAICSTYLDPAVIRRLDFSEIHRFAPSLNAHQLRKASLWLAHEPGVTTERFLEYLTEHNLASNVRIDEVEQVSWHDLKGFDDVIQALETKIALPLENHEWAARLNLKPKRGVLLAGPPGTGKTTIGRALAHRLKGKFFLIDGTFIAGTHTFYAQIDRVFEAAKRNAPSVIFIDDADVMFGGDSENGLYRYLLTKLDGLENTSSGRVCVMMTAMEPADLPIAILRSGRVELWLETRLPDASARADILRHHLATLPSPLCDVDVLRLAAATRGTTGADLKAIVEDGKLLFAADQAAGKTGGPVEAYFLEAMATVHQNRRKYQRRRTPRVGEPQSFGFEGTASSACPKAPGPAPHRAD